MSGRGDISDLLRGARSVFSRPVRAGLPQSSMVPMNPCTNTGHRHHHRPSCSRSMGPDVALSSNLSPNITKVPVASQVTQISMVWQQLSPRASTLSQGTEQTLALRRALGGNKSPGHHPRPWSLQGHKPRHGPKQQPGPGCLHGTSHPDLAFFFFLIISSLTTMTTSL